MHFTWTLRHTLNYHTIPPLQYQIRLRKTQPSDSTAGQLYRCCPPVSSVNAISDHVAHVSVFPYETAVPMPSTSKGSGRWASDAYMQAMPSTRRRTLGSLLPKSSSRLAINRASTTSSPAAWVAGQWRTLHSMSTHTCSHQRDIICHVCCIVAVPVGFCAAGIMLSGTLRFQMAAWHAHSFDRTPPQPRNN